MKSFKPTKMEISCFEYESLVAKSMLLGQIKAQRTELLEALNLLVDDEKCELDHHGNCQTHNLKNPCDIMLSRKLIEKVTAAIVDERETGVIHVHA